MRLPRLLGAEQCCVVGEKQGAEHRGMDCGGRGLQMIPLRAPDMFADPRPSTMRYHMPCYMFLPTTPHCCARSAAAVEGGREKSTAEHRGMDPRRMGFASNSRRVGCGHRTQGRIWGGSERA